MDVATKIDLDTNQSDQYLEISGLHKAYPGQSAPAVENLNLSCRKGEFLSLLGPSGCGKTTTLRMLAGLITPDSGMIQVDGSDITYTPIHRRGMGMVFQSYALFPHLNVFENISYGLDARRIPKTEKQKRVTAVVNLVQLSGFEKRKIRELSGGQQQRVAIARALVIDPSLLLLDEPLSNLDAQLRTSMRNDIRRIQQETRTTTVFVTHDQSEALSISDRVAVLSRGKLEQIGSPDEIYERPSSSFVARFIGSANLLPARVERTSSGTRLTMDGIGCFPFEEAEPSTADGDLMIRPHRIRISAADEKKHAPQSSQSAFVLGEITSIMYTGEFFSYSVQVNEQKISVQELAPEFRRFQTGDRVQLEWLHSDSHFIPAQVPEVL